MHKAGVPVSSSYLWHLVRPAPVCPHLSGTQESSIPHSTSDAVSPVLEGKTQYFPLHSSDAVPTEMTSELTVQEETLSLWMCQLLLCHTSLCGHMYKNCIHINKSNNEEWLLSIRSENIFCKYLGSICIS